MILSGLVFNWIKSANSLAGQFEKAMEADDDEAADENERVDKKHTSSNNNNKFVPKEALDGTKGAEGSGEGIESVKA